MSADIYGKHAAAFNKVSAYVVTDKKGALIARIAFKRGLSVTCFLHIFGLKMTTGRANGGGYDRNSAAAYNAVMVIPNTGAFPEGKILKEFKTALKEGNGGSHWDKALVEAGFNVMQACEEVLLWASLPGDHGGNPYMKQFVIAAQKAVAKATGE